MEVYNGKKSDSMEKIEKQLNIHRYYINTCFTILNS